MRPRLAIVIADTDQHVLAAQALTQTLRGVEPSQVLVFSDRVDSWPTGCQCIRIETIRKIETYNRLITADLAEHLRADHVLVIQYDGFLLNPSCYDPAFLAQDYIGAPWPEPGPHSVGNGGFSLRSRRLVETVASLPYPDLTQPEDVFICRDSRPALEQQGLRFAPRELAQRFSLEWPHVPHATWGFHGVFHLPGVYRQHLDFLFDNLPDHTLRSKLRFMLPFLQTLSPAIAQKARERVAALEAVAAATG